MDLPEPTLASPHPRPTSRSHSSPLTPPPNAPNSSATTGTGPLLTKTGRLSKARGSVPGSAADFRRREANRLAADRSRSRQAEKGQALENAAALLGEENARLREQIAGLEEAAAAGAAGVAGGEGEGQGEGVDVGTEGGVEGGPGEGVEQELSEQSQAGPSRGAQAPPHPASSPSHPSHPAPAPSTAPNDDEDVPTQEQQEAHSHTILAALTDITGVDFSEGNDTSWMQGMESFLKDNDASGRLGELAAVAAHEEGDAAQGSSLAPGQAGERPTGVAGAALAHIHAKLGSQIPLGHHYGQGPFPGANAATVLAAALNTEIERMIMEDLAMTKANVVKLDALILRLQSGEIPAEAEGAVDTALEGLPLNVLSEEEGVLRASMEDVAGETERVQEELPGLKDELVKLRDEKAGEEDRIVALVREIRALGVESVEEEKDKMVAALKSIGGFVESLLNDDHPDSQFITGSYSSPALARRRRGRPPKGEISRTFYQNFLVNSPNSSSGSGSHSAGGDSDPKGKGRQGRKPRRSRLAQSHVASEGEPAGSGSGGPALEQVEQDDPNIDPALREAHLASASGQDAETTAEAVNRAEAFILSHLNAPHPSSSPHPASPHRHRHGHGQGHDERHEGMALDSTSFADFLPAQEALERQAGGSGGDDDAFMTNQTQGSSRLPTGPGSGAGEVDADALDELDEGEHALGEGVLGEEVTPSVLSRLKQGPPGSCDICMRTETTVWRKLVLGGVDHKVCNACGLYHAKFGVIRPPELWGDGKSLKKRRSNQRPAGMLASSSSLPAGEEGSPGEVHDEAGPSRKRQRTGPGGDADEQEHEHDHDAGFAQMLEDSGEQHLGQYMLHEGHGDVQAGEQGGVGGVGEGEEGMEQGNGGADEGEGNTNEAMASVFGV
ncbi:hypothetical protein IAT38_006622 [Cryptococcus sp. DSM 104549]